MARATVTKATPRGQARTSPPQRLPTLSASPSKALGATTREDAAAAPRRLGSILSVTQFWQLMERWHVPDATALELIAYPGKIGTSGKRPRFRFTTRQHRITSYLAEIDAAVAAAGKDSAWLHRKIQSAPFSRKTPIEHIIAHGSNGASEVLRVLNMTTMRAALAMAEASKPASRSVR
jgi:hypothetical protein